MTDLTLLLIKTSQGDINYVQSTLKRISLVKLSSRKEVSDKGVRLTSRHTPRTLDPTNVRHLRRSDMDLTLWSTTS